MTREELQRQREARTGRTPLDQLLALESIPAIASGSVAEPVAGLAGLLALFAGGDSAQAAQGVENVRERLTYAPRTQQGQQALSSIGEALSPLTDVMQGAQTGAGDYVYENTNSPLLGALTQALVGGAPDIAGGLLGAKVLPKGRRYSIGDVGTQGSKFGGKQRGVFAGIKAKTADLDALSKAENLADSGVPMRDIYDSTGWFLAKDGNWNFYIPDKDMKYTPENLPLVEDYRLKLLSPGETLPNPQDYRSGLLAHGVDHPLLQEAYPGLLESINLVDYPFRGKSAGTFRPKSEFSFADDIPASITLWTDQSPFSESKRSVLAHEIQHAIDDFEGGQSGAPSSLPDSEVLNSPIYNAWESKQSTRDAIDKLRNSDRYKKDLAASNKAFEVVEKRIDQILDDASIPGEQKNTIVSELFKEFEARRDVNFPTLKELDDLTMSIPEYIRKEPTSRDVYRSVSGETKARAVQSLLDMLPENVKYPWEFEDLPRNVQYVRTN